MERDDKGIGAAKLGDFPEWYAQVVQKAELADYGPVKGTIAFRPYSYGIWELIQNAFDNMIKKTGHKNAYFPILIPESFIKKESEHFEGFAPEVFWVTHSGNNPLSERLILRPTSETIIYYFMAKWIRSWRDMPLLLNQWCNVTRAEIKDTKPFIRTSEFLWQEGHTAHATHEEAEKEVMQILEFYRKIIEEYIAVPVIIGKKSEREKFAGAEYTMTLEAMMPDGKALQCGTSHNLGQNFSKPFEVKFLDKDEKNKFAYTTSWGISTRLLGALIMVHGDDKGLVLPPRVAPIQAIIVPIAYDGESGKEVLSNADAIAAELNRKGIRTEIDKREGYTPGWKFNYWEMKGVPIRIEIGPKDIANKRAVIVKRVSGEKNPVERDKLLNQVKKDLNSIQKEMFKKASALLKERTTDVNNYEEFKDMLSSKGGFIKVKWCGSGECEEQIKKETTATCRAIIDQKEVSGKCVVCNMDAKYLAYFAKAY